MQKAFDPQVLLQKCREKGGPEAEKLLKKNWEAIKEWVLESAAISENAIVKGAVPLAVPVIDGALQPVLDQVDGVKGN